MSSINLDALMSKLVKRKYPDLKLKNETHWIKMERYSISCLFCKEIIIQIDSNMHSIYRNYINDIYDDNSIIYQHRNKHLKDSNLLLFM